MPEREKLNNTRYALESVDQAAYLIKAAKKQAKSPQEVTNILLAALVLELEQVHDMLGRIHKEL